MGIIYAMDFIIRVFEIDIASEHITLQRLDEHIRIKIIAQLMI